MSRFLLRSGPVKSVLVTTALLIGVALLPGSANAQEVDRSILVNRFVPLVGLGDFPTVEAGGVIPHLSLGAALFINYQRNPLELFAATEDDELIGRLGSVVKDQLSFDLALGFGLFDRVHIAVTFPFTAWMTGDGITELGVPGGGVASAGVSDLRIQLRGLIFEHKPGEDSAIRLGAAVDLMVPTGDDDEFLGERSVGVATRLTAGFTWNILDAGVSLGYRWRPLHSMLFNIEVGDELTYAVALGVRPIEQLRISAALVGGFGLTPFGDQTDEAPMEVDGFVELWPVKTLAVIAGGGAGVHGGVGTPDARAMLGVRFEPSLAKLGKKKLVEATTKADADGDRVNDYDDLCPEEAEDHDGWDDADGCPDPDNDRDGFPDGSDACPDAAEDKDGFEDTDGCPDLDDDKDGVMDEFDLCPGELEDMDGWSDDDGCPEPDNDMDGYLDDIDKCPGEPEVVNGIDDFDGCPDDGESRVFVARDKMAVVVLDAVRFVPKKSALTADGGILVDEIAAHLLRNTWIRKVRITVGAGGKKKLAAARLRAIRERMAGFGLGLGPKARVSFALGDGEAAGVLTFDVLEADPPPEPEPEPAPETAPESTPASPTPPVDEPEPEPVFGDG